MSDPGTTVDNPEEIVVTGTKKSTVPSTTGSAAPLSAAIQVGGQPFPLMAFTVESGAYGSVGHASIVTSLTMLKQSNIDLLKMATQNFSGMPVDVYVTDETGKQSHLFGGEYVDGDWDYDGDMVTISARDWAGPLVDQKRAITSILSGASPDAPDEDATDTTGISTVNVPIKTIVTNIAKLFGLTPVFNLDGASPTVNIGAIYGDSNDTILSTQPQTLWGILNILARDSGNEVYVDPDKNLVFGIPGGNTPIPLLNLAYKMNPVPTDTFPTRGLKFTHNARRNSSFRVLVLSYNPSTAQTTKGEAYVLGDGITTNGQQQISPGTWSGNNAALISNSLTQEDKKFPLYTFHVDGLTAQQAQIRATAIANDIAKREFIMTAHTDLIALVRPMNHTKLTGDVDPGFLGQDYYVNRYKHTYVMPTGEAAANGGMVTELTLLNIKQEGTGSPLTKKAATK